MKRCDRVSLPGLELDRDAREPLYRQLHDALRRAILTGELEPGSALPSTRQLAKSLRISRNTVLNAYEELLFAGLVVGRIGSGTRVRGRLPIEQAGTPMLDWRRIVRAAHYPADAVRFSDSDGNSLYLHR